MNIRNPYKVESGNISLSHNTSGLRSGKILIDKKEKLTCGSYDDTDIKRRLSILENKVETLDTDGIVNIARRVAILEGKIDHYVTQEEFSHLEGRVTTLEETPVGLSNSQMNEILN